VRFGTRCTDRHLGHQFCRSKRRFSQFACQPSCSQEYACCLEQGLNDEATPIVAQGEALVLQQRGIAAFHRPALLTQGRSARLAAFVDVRLGAKAAAQGAIGLGIVAPTGEQHCDPGHNGEGGKEQALEQDGVVDIGRGGYARDRHTLAGDCDLAFCAPLAAAGGVGSGEFAAAFGAQLATVHDQGRVAAQHGHQQCVHLAQQSCLCPALKGTAQGQPLALPALARRLRHGVPSRRNWRRVASTRTVSARGCPGARSRGSSQHPITVAIRFKILMSKAVSVSINSGDGYRHGEPEVRPAQPRVVVETASKNHANVQGAANPGHGAEFDFRHNNRGRLGVDEQTRSLTALHGIVGKRMIYRRPAD